MNGSLSFGPNLLLTKSKHLPGNAAISVDLHGLITSGIPLSLYSKLRKDSSSGVFFSSESMSISSSGFAICGSNTSNAFLMLTA